MADEGGLVAEEVKVKNPKGQTDTPAFKRWFGSSKVVDANGDPLVVYHGTTAGKFEEFRPFQRKGEQLGFGIHFSQDKALAEMYAHDPTVTRKGKLPHVFSAYLSVQRPLYADQIAVEGSPEYALSKTLAGKRFWTQTGEDGRKVCLPQGAIDSTTAVRAEKLIREAGFDGIRYLAQMGQQTGRGMVQTARAIAWVVFDPRQVKEISNVGTFDPDDPNMFRNPSPSRTFTPPAAVAAEARLGLAIRAQQPPSQRCCTPVGLRRASQLANRQPVSVRTLKRMRSYFQRHAVDAKGARWDDPRSPSKGKVAWLIWGGDSGRKWCNKVLNSLGE